MAISFIKYFAIIFYSLFLYMKILNYKKVSFLKIIIAIFFSSGLSLSMYELRIIIPQLSILIMIMLMGVFVAVITQKAIDLATTAIALSSSISFAFFMIATFIAASISQWILGKTDIDVFLFLITFAVQSILVNIPFRIKRLKNGFTFLNKKGAGSLGLFISAVLLSFVILISNSKDADMIKLLPFLGIIICAAGIFFWWRSGITKAYIERLKTKEFEDALKQISENEEQINKLTQHNSFLAGIIHKDNKIIPSLELAVREFLTVPTNDMQHLKLRGQQLLEQIEAADKERKGIILQYQSYHKKLPSTNVPGIDTIINYMFNKATENKIQFDLIVIGNINFMVENVISESKIKALLADLAENAIISTRQCDYKKILITVGLAGDCYELSIDDSGVPFCLDILPDLGLKQVTTHKDDGGSGIGMMTVFSILRETGASFIIDEYEHKPFSFSKRLTVRFDNKNLFIISSHRTSEIESKCKRTDIVFQNGALIS